MSLGTNENPYQIINLIQNLSWYQYLLFHPQITKFCYMKMCQREYLCRLMRQSFYCFVLSWVWSCFSLIFLYSDFPLLKYLFRIDAQCLFNAFTIYHNIRSCIRKLHESHKMSSRKALETIEQACRIVELNTPNEIYPLSHHTYIFLLKI